MDKKVSDEIMETVKELREFSKVCLNVAAWVEGVKAKIMQWDNVRENAEMLARQAQADLEDKQANLQMELQRLPNELAPLRNKIAQQERDANRLMSDAVLKSKEAAVLLEKARALHADVKSEPKAESVAAPKAAEAAPKRRGRPKAEPKAG